MQFSSIIPWFVEKACYGHEQLAAELGLSPWVFAIAAALVYVVLFVPVWLAWRVARKRFHVNGFSDVVWKGWLHVSGGFSLLQILNHLSQPLFGPIVPCPYDFALACALALQALFGLYCYHLGKNNKASFVAFCSFVVVPVFADIVVGWREALVPGVKFLKVIAELGAPVLRSGAEHAVQLVERLLPMLHIAG
jgi:hypothetical protein